MKIRSKFDESGYTGFCITLHRILLYNILRSTNYDEN